MNTLQTIKDAIPDYAKDIRLNFDSVLARSSLDPIDAIACALSAAVAAKSTALVEALSLDLPEAERLAALTAASLMGMNNIWYPFVEMAQDDDLKTLRPELRMNAYASFGGVSKLKFEAYALSASIVGKCHFCIQSHYALLKADGMSTLQLRDIGRIAAVVHAVSNVLHTSLLRT